MLDLSLFKSIEKDGVPEIKEGRCTSNKCLVFVPGIPNQRVDSYLVAYYHNVMECSDIFDTPKWICHQTGGIRYLEPTHYIELPPTSEAIEFFNTKK